MPAADFEELAGVFEDEEIKDGTFVEGRVKVAAYGLEELTHTLKNA